LHKRIGESRISFLGDDSGHGTNEVKKPVCKLSFAKGVGRGCVCVYYEGGRGGLVSGVFAMWEGFFNFNPKNADQN